MIETKHTEPITYRIYDYLKENCVGEINAIPARDLAAHFKISERQLRDYIRQIRNSTELEKTVCATPKGYFVCKDKEEFIRANGTLYAAAFNLLRTARANSKKAGMEGQGKIPLGKYYKEFVEAFGE